MFITFSSTIKDIINIEVEISFQNIYIYY